MRQGLRTLLAALILASLLLANGVGAAPITYTETAIATGTLGSTAFTNSLVMVSITGDTSDVTAFEPGLLLSAVGVASVTVAGLGTATFTSGAVALDDQAEPGAGIGLTSGALNGEGHPPFILGTYASVFATYDLTNAVGPVTGPAQIDAGVALQTSNGALVLNSAGDVTFTATTTASAVPEPVSIALLSTSLLGFGLIRRHAACSVF